MTFLTVPAHCLDDEFEDSIRVDFGVTIRDRKNEPWCVVFEGDRANLVEMHNKHWADGQPEQIIDAESTCLTEYAPGLSSPDVAIEKGGS